MAIILGREKVGKGTDAKRLSGRNLLLGSQIREGPQRDANSPEIGDAAKTEFITVSCW